jgi:hypothetical protein
MKVKILLSLIITLTVVSISLAQYVVPTLPGPSVDTIFIPGGTMSGGENAGSMDATINADITSGARTNPNRVYALYEGEVYYQLKPILVNDPTGTLSIVGVSDADPNYTKTTGRIQGTTKPIIFIQPTNGEDVFTPDLGNGGCTNEVTGSLKFVNVEYITMQTDGQQNNELFSLGTANSLPQSLTVDNSLFEFSNIDLFDCTQGDGDNTLGGWPNGAKIRLTNSYFRNLFYPGQWWGGRVFQCKEPMDTLWVENCTVTNGGLTFLQYYTLATFAYFNHNTLVNNYKYWLIGGFYINFIVTNNIFLNQNWVGEDTNVTQSGQDPDREFMSTIDIDTTDAYHNVAVQPQYYNSNTNTYSSAVSLANMKVFVSDNVNYWDPLLINGYYTNSTYTISCTGSGGITAPPSYIGWFFPNSPYAVENIPGEWMNSRTQTLFQHFAPPKGKFIMQNTYTAKPNTPTPDIVSAAEVTDMAVWNQNKWSDPRFPTAPNITSDGTGFVYGPYSATVITGKINGVASNQVTGEGTGIQVGITKFTDLVENFSQSNIISKIDGLPVGSLIWNDAENAAYSSANDFSAVQSAYTTALNGTTYKRGNVDGSGPDAYSASLILEYLVGLDTLNAQQLAAADVDLDGQITAEDAAWILHYVVYGEFPDGSLPKTAQVQSGSVAVGQLSSQGNSNLVTIPIILQQSRGIQACYVELNIDGRYADVVNVSGSLPQGWLMANNYSKGVLRIAMAGVSPLPDGTIATISLNLKNNGAKFGISGSAKLNANLNSEINNFTITAVPTQFGLSQNYPNPFNPSTVINYQLAQNTHVGLMVYDILGQKVKTLINGMQQAGYYNITWDGTNDSGRKVASGVYIYRLESGSYIKTLKMNLLK